MERKKRERERERKSTDEEEEEEAFRVGGSGTEYGVLLYYYMYCTAQRYTPYITSHCASTNTGMTQSIVLLLLNTLLYTISSLLYYLYYL